MVNFYKFYYVYPDEGTAYVSVSGMNKVQRKYITETLELEIEDEEHRIESGGTYIFPCYVDAPYYQSTKFDELLMYLKKEGFQVVGVDH